MTRSRDLFIFCKTSDNISLTVQDKDLPGTCSYNGTLIGNRMWPIKWHQVTFAVVSCGGTAVAELLVVFCVERLWQ